MTEIKQDVEVKVEDQVHTHMGELEPGTFFRCAGNEDSRAKGLFMLFDDRIHSDDGRFPAGDKRVFPDKDPTGMAYDVWSFKRRMVMVISSCSSVEVARVAKVYCMF